MPGPPGSVPEVSNERRPGLTYNTHTSSTDPEWVKTANELVHEGYSPNFVGRQVRQTLVRDGASDEQAATLVQSWLEDVFAVNEWEEVDTHSEDATIHESEVEAEPEVPVDEWELVQGQEHREATGDLPERITHVGKKRGVRYHIDPNKKYSIVDPEAEPLTDGETSDISGETAERVGSGTDPESTNHADQAGRD
jgi:hypothetical protein